MIRQVGSIAAMVLTVWAGTAHALGYVNNRDQWQALTPEARIGYVQGLNDSLNYSFVDDTLVNALAKRGRTQCLIERQLTSAKLVELIDIAYRAEQNRNLAPAALYIIRITEICRDAINRSRQEFGLGPQ